MTKHEISRLRAVSTAAASSWNGSTLFLSNSIYRLIGIHVEVTAGTEDYALPVYVEYVYHQGKQDAETYVLGRGTVKYREPFVITNPFVLEGPGMIQCQVFHHDTSHTHTLRFKAEVIDLWIH